MKSLSLSSPAKINLYLRILGRMPDGYHRLATLFHRLSLQDTLILKKVSRSGIRLSCGHPEIPTDEGNLIVRAYRLLQTSVPDLGGVEVRLIKRIPVQGGLGGGSSNAAVFLNGMNRLFALQLKRQRLQQLGRQLGADVPFFLEEVNQALGLERGDVLIPLPAKVKKWFVLVTFEDGLSTRSVYQSLTYDKRPVSLTNVRRIVRIASHSLDRKDSIVASKWLQNDLEVPAIWLKPSIQGVLEKMVQLGAPLSAMSGSGPTVFAAFFSYRERERFIRRLSPYVAPERIIRCHTF